jgi:hypothetical protein
MLPTSTPIFTECWLCVAILVVLPEVEVIAADLRTDEGKEFPVAVLEIDESSGFTLAEETSEGQLLRFMASPSLISSMATSVE